jgi:hypothetical protein
MFPVICKKTPAMSHVGLWGQSASSSHGMNVSASRCALLTLKSTTDLNACGFEGYPVHVTSSISPLSYRTLRPWRSVPSAHPLRPSSRQREKSYDGASEHHSQNRLQVSPPCNLKQSTTRRRLFRQHRSDSVFGRCPLHVRFSPDRDQIADVAELRFRGL